MIRKQKSRAILARNRKINKINIFILGTGLLFIFLGWNEVGPLVIWSGVLIFVYTQLSSIIARRT